jgi:hypothetical protein
MKKRQEEGVKGMSALHLFWVIPVMFVIGVGIGYIIAFPSKVDVTLNATPQMTEAIRAAENISKNMQWSQDKFSNKNFVVNGSNDYGGICPKGTVYVEQSGLSSTTYCDVITYPNGSKEQVNCRSYDDLVRHFRCLNGTVQENVKVS